MQKSIPHPERRIDSFTDSCCHRNIPVETDESMTSSTLDLVWPSGCGPKEEGWFAPEVTVNDVCQVDDPKDPWRSPVEDPLGQPPPPAQSPLPAWATSARRVPPHP
ncbi:hypothetical protein J4Q44_G00343460 [Coregonus suidteri]|uniref:Uncharacterized protein n=1 Tax=Coregonus suidteri TaxID=861788 RepID=A0AAN8L015_9TELE